MKICPQCSTLNDDARKWCAECMKVFGADVKTLDPAPPVHFSAPTPTPAPIELRKRVECPFCHVSGHVYTKSNTTTGGIIMVVLLLFVCFPLFWVPLLTMTERHAFCDACKMRIN